KQRESTITFHKNVTFAWACHPVSPLLDGTTLDHPKTQAELVSYFHTTKIEAMTATLHKMKVTDDTTITLVTESVTTSPAVTQLLDRFGILGRGKYDFVINLSKRDLAADRAEL